MEYPQSTRGRHDLWFDALARWSTPYEVDYTYIHGYSKRHYLKSYH